MGQDHVESVDLEGAGTKVLTLGPVLIDRSRIAARVRELGATISADLDASMRHAHAGDSSLAGSASGAEHAEPEVVLIPILTGSIIFVADLIREMPRTLSLELVAVSSYPGQSTKSKGAKIASALPGNLAGKHVVVVDDILDSGQTLGLVRDAIRRQEPATLRVCVLLRKPESERVTPVEAEYVGFEIPSTFVVGYGLDYGGLYRNLPDIRTMVEGPGTQGRG
ncbi:MAG: phosphoribosyltransferase family protein [Planctomycetota bacterium]|nr:phosphoribosyltransferase family protein [Planctomycetota bacterium]